MSLITHVMLMNVAPVPFEFDPDALAYFASLNNEPSPARKMVYNTAFLTLKSSGIWYKTDAIQFRAAENEDQATMDLKNLWSAIGVGTFVADTGLQGVNSNYMPINDGAIYYTNDSAAYALMVSGHVSGDYTFTDSQSGHLKFSGGTITFQICEDLYGNGTYPSAPIASPNGFWVANRTDVNASDLYLNNSHIVSGTGASFNPIGTFISDSTAVNSVFFWCGGPLDSTERAALQSIVDTYLASL